MPTLKVRALPIGEHQYFRRCGLTFAVGSEKLVQVDEPTAKLLEAETRRLLVRRVDGADEALPPAASFRLEMPEEMQREIERVRADIEEMATAAERRFDAAQELERDARTQLEEARAALAAAEKAKADAEAILAQAAATKLEAERLAAAAAPPPVEPASAGDGEQKPKGSEPKQKAGGGK